MVCEIWKCSACSNCKRLLNTSTLDIIWFIPETSKLFFPLTFNKIFYKCFGTGLHQGDLLEREQSCKRQLFKVTNTGKKFSNVFISLQLTRNDVKSLPIKIMSKKVSKDNVHISTIEITSKKVRGNHVDFSTIEITSRKVRGSHVDFSTSEIKLKKYVETTWIFRPAKLH